MAFISEIVQATNIAAASEIQDLIEVVSDRVRDLKFELTESMTHVFADRDADFDRITSWKDELLGLEKELEGFQGQFHNKKKTLNEGYEKIEWIEEQLYVTESNINILNCLISAVENVERVELMNNPYAASKKLKQAKECLADLDADANLLADHNKTWMCQLHAFIKEQERNISEHAVGLWRTMFTFDSENTSLIIGRECQSMLIADEISQLVVALQNVDAFTKCWNFFCTKLWSAILSKACTPQCDVQISFLREGYPLNRYNDDEENAFKSIPVGCQVGIHLVKSSSSTVDVEKIFNNVVTILTIFHQLFSGEEELMVDLGKTLGGKLMDAFMGQKKFKTLILQNAHGDRDKALNDLGKLKSFIEKLHSDLCFRFPDDVVQLANFEANFDKLMLAQVREDLLAKIRRCIKSNLNDTVDATESILAGQEGDPEEIQSIQRNPYLYPKCIISKSIQEIIFDLQEHMQQYPDDSEIAACGIDLYLAISSISKTDSSQIVPYTAVIMHNNSMFLAYHCGNGLPECEEKIPFLRAKAKQSFSAMIRCLRTKLNLLIHDAMTGVDETIAVKKEFGEKVLTIAQEFISLDNEFKEVLSPKIWDEALATLVDHTINEMCSKVIALDDISVDTANELASVFNQFGIHILNLFNEESLSDRELEGLTAKKLQKWRRFRLLIFILTASMKEIGDKWVDGCGPMAMEFDAEEVRRLVRSLFQNTDRRAAFLASIK